MLTYDPEENKFFLSEGRYVFKVREKAEMRYAESASGREYTYIIFKFAATNSKGESKDYNEIFVPWEDRWKDLLKALGGQESDDGKIHLSEVDSLGEEIIGDIVHTDHPNRPGEIRTKIINIRPKEEKTSPSETEDNSNPADEDDSIPF